ncbi:MAG TPA: hypothetical protein VK404_00500 [Spirosoma sp.]|jgi:uncharacterized protein YdhG (YjbR/CyaY superfamily)|nr:hypothetical protein [Spirosoma sp.]
MENYQLTPAWTTTSTKAPVIKESIRDMMRLQQEHQVPDELFWEIFNARVLLNRQIDINAFLSSNK